MKEPFKQYILYCYFSRNQTRVHYLIKCFALTKPHKPFAVWTANKLSDKSSKTLQKQKQKPLYRLRQIDQ